MRCGLELDQRHANERRHNARLCVFVWLPAPQFVLLRNSTAQRPKHTAALSLSGTRIRVAGLRFVARLCHPSRSFFVFLFVSVSYFPSALVSCSYFPSALVSH